MILTGSEILRRFKIGDIVIDPFDENQLNPNSYNYRLGNQLKIPTIDFENNVSFKTVDIPESGYVIQPGMVHLGHTFEILGSKKYAMSLIGRSSLGRIGLFLQVSANLGHVGSCHRWTLEIVSAKPIKLYPYMRIGQISFWTSKGEVSPYLYGYSKFNSPQVSKYLLEAE